MPGAAPHERFAGLTYESFQAMARDETLTEHERSGFPDAYRDGAESAIIGDILQKLPVLATDAATVADIGCGAGPLPAALRDHCHAHGHHLLLIDGPDVLARHPDADDVTKLPGRFPGLPGLLEDWGERCDAIIAYSVIQYSFADASVFSFLDAVLRMLRPGGRALIADLPNASMRRRFLASEAGQAHHRTYTGTDAPPELPWPEVPVGEPDDAVVLGLVARARAAGFHGWLVPQAPTLPMANRREDLLLERP